MNALTPGRLALWLIALPMALLAFYYSFIAADRYVSETVVAVRQSGDSGKAAAGLSLMLGGINPPAREDTLYLREYIQSLDMLRHLDQTLDLRAAYGAEPIDVFYRLFPDTSQEWFLKYYRNRVEAGFDDVTALLTVRVQGFTPEFAHAMAEAILAESERFINEVSHRMARERMAFAEGELDKASKRYRRATTELVEFQNRYNVLDPVAHAQALSGIAVELETTLVRQEAELKNLRTYLQDEAHQVVALKNQVGALKAQLSKERNRVAAPEGQQLNVLAAEFQGLTLQARFAEDGYKLALAALENARIDATQNLKSLAVIQTPSQPETADYPRRLHNLATALLALSLLYGVVRLLIATIQDHGD
jgi:capsular polysaccharide transport system permease protein